MSDLSNKLSVLKITEQDLLADYQKIIHYFSPDGKYNYKNDWKQGMTLCNQALINSNQTIKELSERLKDSYIPEEQEKIKQLCVRAKLFSDYFELEKSCAQRPVSTWKKIIGYSLVTLNVASLGLAILALATDTVPFSKKDDLIKAASQGLANFTQTVLALPISVQDALTLKIYGIWLASAASGVLIGSTYNNLLYGKIRQREAQKLELDKLTTIMQKAS